MFTINIGREIHELIVIRNRPMLTCLEACIEQLESREQEPDINLLLRYARAAVERERAFHKPDFIKSRTKRG
jgi:BMFP domain-containing protein YqiC